MVVAIPGATSAAQAQENAGALSFSLTKQEMDCLEKVSAAVR